ncbi:autotransporter outer membrane beta-barrel domain-containing protein [Aquabacter cavernae]|uniref:autotransporter family protein n=1 Tax=Aquabacter cavernae TaxID=2496029 RepID=UPI000F8F197D|nr:autotransporter outer membrane beta-barrel domain-containing protein [Aquabacter cavernae]
MNFKGSLAAGLGLIVCAQPALAEPEPAFSYETLRFEGLDTFFTGIHANIITGNYIIPGTTYTGGLLYDMGSGTWSAFPQATANGANYPGAIISSPYGPSFGSQSGILRAVGSYQTTASAPYDIGYLYDGAAAPGQQLTNLQYPSSGGSPTLFTIAHSTFGNQVVGNYDTQLDTGNAFIYDIRTGAYTTNNKPGAISTTAYGIWGDKIAGGYFEAAPGGGLGPEKGYIYDKVTGTFTEYNHPGAIATHFEGIVGAGRTDEYNLVANWITADGETHPAVMHVAADGSVTWYEINIPGDTVSSNSAYGDKVVGIVQNGSSITAYIATIPGLYNPIRNTGTLTSSADNAAALSGRKSDDIVNSGTVHVSGVAGVGMRGETYGVLTNSGTVTATGLVGAAVELHGVYGTLLNSGTLQAEPVADVLRTGPDSFGTVIVNTGIIDGRIAATAGPEKRFENSGWIGVSGTGVSITHLLSGTYVQTQAGTLSLRVGDTGSDFLGITGVARLAGTLQVPFLTSDLSNSYTLMAVTDGMTGTFDTLATSGLPTFVSAQIGYSDTQVMVNLTSQMGQQAGLTANQSAVGAGLDRAFNSGASANAGAAADSMLTTLYGLSAAQLPLALSALSGEAYASQQTVLAGDSLYSRSAVLDRLRQGAYGGTSGPLAALAYGGPALANLGPQMTAAASASQALAYAAPAPVAPSAIPMGTTAWVQGFGGWTSYDGKNGTSGVDSTVGGLMAGADIQAGAWRVGAALGYSQSGASVSDLNASSTVNSMLVALYGGTMLGPVNVRLGATYAFNQVDASRAIAFPGFLETATAQYDGGTGQIFAELGYGFAVQGLALEPFAGLALVHVNTDGFTENGAPAAGLTAGSATSNIGYGTLGLRAATSFALSNGMVLAPHASAAWQYAFGDTTPSAQLAISAVPGAAFSVSGVPLAQNAALMEAGIDLIVTPQARVGASYVGQFGDGVTVNAFSANLSWTF